MKVKNKTRGLKKIVFSITKFEFIEKNTYVVDQKWEYITYSNKFL